MIETFVITIVSISIGYIAGVVRGRERELAHAASDYIKMKANPIQVGAVSSPTMSELEEIHNPKAFAGKREMKKLLDKVFKQSPTV